MIETLTLHFIGYAVFSGVLYVIWRSNARRWTRLARVYRAADGIKCDSQRTLQTVILIGGDAGWNSYKGIVTVSVTREGILLRLMPPFSFFHPPLLIPFSDSDIVPKRWYVFGKTSQFILREVSDVQIIVHDDLLHWVESQAASLAVAAE